MTVWLKDMFSRFNKPLIQIEWVLICTNLIFAVFVALEQEVDSHFLSPTSNLGIIIEEYRVAVIAYLALGITSLVHIYFLVSPKKFFRDRSYIAMIYAVLYMFTAIILLLTLGFNHILWIDRLAFFWIASVVYLGLRTQHANANK
jgi:hypothetical protein